MNSALRIENINTFEEFTKEVASQISEMLDKSITVKVFEGKKKNNISKVGIEINGNHENITPVIYLEEAFEQYLRGESITTISKNIIEFYSKLPNQPFPCNIDKLEDFDYLKDKILFKVINADRNKEILSECPHIYKIDLAIVFYALLDKSSFETATFLIKREHMKEWGISEDELMKIALENSEKLEPATLLSVEEVMLETMFHTVPQNFLHESSQRQSESIQMYVLTNESRRYGAGCIFYNGMLDKVGNILGEDFYILPSSIHDCIILPITSSLLDMEEVNEMICKTNELAVIEEEQLNNHCYKYSIASRKFY